MKRRAWLAPISAPLVLSLSCGGEDSNGSSGPSIDEIPTIMAEVICEQFVACVGQEAVDAYWGPSGCAERARASIEDGDFPYLVDAVDMGRVTYNAERVDACVAKIAELRCNLESTRIKTLSPCDEVLVGILRPGDDCSVDDECSGAAFCNMRGGCPGTCTTLLTEGVECEQSDDCGNNLVCSEISDTCNARAGPGEACGEGEAKRCRLGLICVSEEGAANQGGTCKTEREILVGKKGDPCNPQTGDLCDKGLSCAFSGPLLDPKDCTCTAPVGSGEPCALAAPTQCPQGEYCAGTSIEPANPSLQGTCTPLPGAGDPCAEDPFSGATEGCAAGLFCETDNKCHPVNRLGEPCVSHDGCANGNCKEGVCVRPEQCKL